MTQIWNDMLAAAARVARTTSRSRVVLGVVSAIIAAGVAMAVLAITSSSPGHATPAAAPKAATRAAPRARTAQASRPDTIPVRGGSTLVATLATAVPRYTRPGGNPDGTVLATWYGRPSALPVIAQKPGWVKVRLATRPNGSTAWVRSAHLTFSQTPYRIVVNLSTKHVQMLVSGRVVLNAPAGIGTGTDPTPPGQFFVAFYEQSLGPGYGPFILVTSADSDAIADWEGSGDAVIGIHGPLGADIGSSGVAVSHGCIRLPIDDLVRLAGLPAGTPITIAA
jgi:lipoprotein-anchoring transpeptidase ErfK/SrfK